MRQRRYQFSIDTTLRAILCFSILAQLGQLVLPDSVWAETCTFETLWKADRVETKFGSQTCNKYYLPNGTSRSNGSSGSVSVTPTGGVGAAASEEERSSSDGGFTGHSSVCPKQVDITSALTRCGEGGEREAEIEKLPMLRYEMRCSGIKKVKLGEGFFVLTSGCITRGPGRVKDKVENCDTNWCWWWNQGE